ncbi:hypothetical protein NPIL_346421 [Nephila pilipes]|uniref:Uncharacterized protein n=1 Tax=Nephila pilipes TaxID=299642 RepID=A0A8X6MZA1_NEPPI|nr:hypothetical protein NPIL_346421 [Nephila pilipes]
METNYGIFHRIIVRMYHEYQIRKSIHSKQQYGWEQYEGSLKKRYYRRLKRTALRGGRGTLSQIPIDFNFGVATSISLRIV